MLNGKRSAAARRDRRRRGGDSARAPLTLFAEIAGAFYLRPAALNSYRLARAASPAPAAAVPDAAHISALRSGLDPRRLRDCGYEGGVADISDAAIAVAAAGGVVANAAFLDIVDNLLVRSSCLCCYRARSRERAAAVEEQILILLSYYDQSSYEGSTAYYRVLCGLLRDISAPEADMIARHTFREPAGCAAAADAAADAVAAFSRLPGVCAVRVGHAAVCSNSWAEPGVLAGAGISICVYSTPEGRQLLRRLGRECKAAGMALTTRVATNTSYEFFCLRYKLRLYAMEVHCKDGAGPANPLGAFWKCIAAATRATAKRGTAKKSRSPGASRAAPRQLAAPSTGDGSSS